MSSRTFKYAIYQGLIFLDCVGNGTAYGEDLRVYKWALIYLAQSFQEFLKIGFQRHDYAQPSVNMWTYQETRNWKSFFFSCILVHCSCSSERASHLFVVGFKRRTLVKTSIFPFFFFFINFWHVTNGCFKTLKNLKKCFFPFNSIPVTYPLKGCSLRWRSVFLQGNHFTWYESYGNLEKFRTFILYKDTMNFLAMKKMSFQPSFPP